MKKGVSQLAAYMTLFTAVTLATSVIITSIFKSPNNLQPEQNTTSTIVTSVSTVYSTAPEYQETTTVSSRINTGGSKSGGQSSDRGSGGVTGTTGTGNHTTSTTTIQQELEIECIGSSDTHACSSDLKSIDSIKNFDAPTSANCSDKITISFKWNGWHLEDPNHWAFFLKDSEGNYNFVNSCTSNVTDTYPSNYSMSFDLLLPSAGAIRNGIYELFVTGEDSGGYCNPNENGIDAHASRSITLNNCGDTISSSSSTTTTSTTTSSITTTSTTTTICDSCSQANTCTDSDSGLECLQYVTYATCTDINGEHSDKCKDDYTLNESHCTNDVCGYNLINCKDNFGNGYGCKDGKCVLLSNPISGAMIMSTGAVTASTPINLGYCTGSPTHGGDANWDIEQIKSLAMPDTANCGQKIITYITWRGWHGWDPYHCEPNYWGFFLQTSSNQYYFLSSCESSYLEDCPLEDSNAYIMQKALIMPPKGSIHDGQYKLFVTGETIGGYTNPYEANPIQPDACKNPDYFEQYCYTDAQINKTINLRNCEAIESSTTTTTSSSTTTSTTSTIPPSESSTTSSSTTTSSTTSSTTTTVPGSTPPCAYILSTTSTTTTTITQKGGGGGHFMLDLVNMLREFIAKIFGLK